MRRIETSHHSGSGVYSVGVLSFPSTFDTTGPAASAHDCARAFLYRRDVADAHGQPAVGVDEPGARGAPGLLALVQQTIAAALQPRGTID
ncbi:hypothetical protein PAXRUDRAFT_822838 [Paxillus rubicundulus Ve08.2h10]|uniref:Uncharacterized protein n=1 Tax=Paxillus rubicundulus Ve08.2h10 TaxID=930991 RepID=A0A0D0DLA9_9AGAM|nr:hypothetical protein PAXRUDRAFT_822838 [Paxillus rubicundulus Ve08.2h10]